MREDLPPKERKSIQTMLYVLGLAFVILGIIIFMKPSIVEILSLDEEMGQMMGGLFVLMGFSEFLLARFVFNTNETK